MAGYSGCPACPIVGMSVLPLPQAGLGESQHACGQGEVRAAPWMLV